MEVPTTIQDGFVINILHDLVDGSDVRSSERTLDEHGSSVGGSNESPPATGVLLLDGGRTAAASRGTLSTPDAAEWPVGVRVTGA